MALPILLSIVATLWLWLLFAATGAAVSALLKTVYRSRGLAVLTRFGIGFGCTAMVIMVLCIAGRSTPAVILATLGILTACFVPFMHRVISDYAALGRVFFREYLVPQPLIAGFLLLLLAGYWFRGLLPPLEFDTLMYHLSIAKLYLHHGGFYDIFFNAQADYPMLTEMNYMIGLALKNDIICKGIASVVGMHAVAATAFIARRYAGGRQHHAVIAALIFCTFTTIIAGMSTCYVDIPQALWTLLAIIALEEHRRDSSYAWLWTCGIFAGMAAGTKVFGVFVFPVLVIQLLATPELRRSVWDLIKRLATIGIPSLIFGLPWFVKSFIYKGTILSISHASIAGQGLANPMNVETASPFLSFLINIPGRLAAAPWTFSLFPSQHQSDTFGPLLLAVLPFMFFSWKMIRGRFLLLAAAVYFCEVLIMEMFFIQGGSSIRYSTVVLMVAAAFIPLTVDGLSAHPVIGRMLKAMVIITILASSLLFFKRYHKEWRPLAVNQTREAYCTAVLPEYEVIKAINALPGGKKVMPIYNYSDYLIDVPFFTLCRSYPSTEAMKQDLIARNVGYIFANDKLDTADNSRAFPDLGPKTVVAAKNGFYLYRLDF